MWLGKKSHRQDAKTPRDAKKKQCLRNVIPAKAGIQFEFKAERLAVYRSTDSEGTAGSGCGELLHNQRYILSLLKMDSRLRGNDIQSRGNFVKGDSRLSECLRPTARTRTASPGCPPGCACTSPHRSPTRRAHPDTPLRPAGSRVWADAASWCPTSCGRGARL